MFMVLPGSDRLSALSANADPMAARKYRQPHPVNGR